MDNYDHMCSVTQTGNKKKYRHFISSSFVVIITLWLQFVGPSCAILSILNLKWQISNRRIIFFFFSFVVVEKLQFARRKKDWTKNFSFKCQKPFQVENTCVHSTHIYVLCKLVCLMRTKWKKKTEGNTIFSFIQI